MNMATASIRAELVRRVERINHILASHERLDGYIHLKHKRVLPQLSRAIQKIDEGTYGLCDDCSENIPVDRLAFAMGATRCTCCQALWEKSLRT